MMYVEPNVIIYCWKGEKDISKSLFDYENKILDVKEELEKVNRE